MQETTKSQAQGASRKMRRFVDLVDGQWGPQLCVTGTLVLPDAAELDPDLTWSYQDPETGQEWLVEDIFGNMC